MATKLLLIEDHQALREGLALLLVRHGIEVVGSVGDFDAGLALAEELEPNVCLVDVGLGERSGIELTRRLVERHPRSRVLLYTGNGDCDALVEGMEAGAVGYLLKDGAGSELVEAIRVVADGGRFFDPRLRPRVERIETLGRLPALSPREREIIDLLARGMTGEQVAESLVLSAGTVKTHIRNAMGKLGANTRVHAVTLALREGQITLAGASDAPGSSIGVPNLVADVRAPTAPPSAPAGADRPFGRSAPAGAVRALNRR